MHKNKHLALVVASVFLATLWGCGSNMDSGGDQTGPDTTLADAQPLGINNCLTCHQTSAQTWLTGVHGNPAVSEPNSGLVDPACLTCHDQLGDGQKLFTATNGDEANRPVVSCESCHGGGQYHNGIAAGIPFAVPDSSRCGQCHNATFPHGFSPEGKGIVEAFQVSPHSRSLNASVFVAGTTDVRARCSKCHSDEGAKQYLNVDGDYAALTANLPNTLAPLSKVSNIDCRTCHSPHQEDQLLEAASSGRSAEFNTCTNCHQLLQASNSEKIIAYHDPAANQFGAANEIITDTHFATPGNFPGSARGANQNDITGYAMNFASDRVCRDCHNPHNANTEINNQWAGSDHADKTAAGAWAHYNWTEIPGAVRNDFTVVGATGSRTTCQRCHTTTGFIAYLTANADADPSDYVAPLGYNPNFKPEMLKCNGCHSDNLGSLRATGQIIAPYTNAPDQYPDAGGSNLCLACHTGVESGESIKNSTADFAATGFINSHYLTAGGTVFAKSGYTFGDRDYSIPAGDRHDKIGMGITTGDANFDAVRSNYTEGPCVTCHFDSNDGSHTLSPLTAYAPGDVSLNPVCVVCHTSRGAGTNAETTWLGTEAIAETLQGTTHKARYQAALEALKVQLANNGYTFTTGYPYFANTNWVSMADPTGKNNMGAAFNYNLLIHDPGGVVHNRRYTRRLIYDAIDHLDDGILNYSVAATLNALDTTAVYKASAINYLLKAQNGDAGDRH